VNNKPSDFSSALDLPPAPVISDNDNNSELSVDTDVKPLEGICQAFH
jgi:hypothetical protein